MPGKRLASNSCEAHAGEILFQDERRSVAGRATPNEHNNSRLNAQPSFVSPGITGRSKDVMSIGTTPKASSDLDLGGGCVVFRQPWLASNFLAGV
ncbi:hypothetical protein POX_a00325 [Penicillium oxalicum]|uniref:hypothetical protein n=1 Tax=Penicillium oxalicum TaxID=69781 RepID=UPI0020B897F4|nr:hypothetical protein POX_a00325 [Penicillium oxalicum]KAI2793741.1 hypothetical protein POX_a00325 [Penicillium oxalicum]